MYGDKARQKNNHTKTNQSTNTAIALTISRGEKKNYNGNLVLETRNNQFALIELTKKEEQKKKIQKNEANEMSKRHGLPSESFQTNTENSSLQKMVMYRQRYGN